MAPHEIKSTLEVMDKAWHKSKKFLAFTIMEVFLFALAVYILFITRTLGWAHASVLITIIFSMASLALAFNTSQAKLDTYVRGMALLGKGVGEEIQGQFLKDIGMVPAKKEPPQE